MEEPRIYMYIFIYIVTCVNGRASYICIVTCVNGRAAYIDSNMCKWKSHVCR